MAIKDSIVNLKKGLRTTLTNVPALIDTLVRGLDGVAEEIEKGEVYSSDERVVGTWIDGTEIYETAYAANVSLIPDWNGTTIDATGMSLIIDTKVFSNNGRWYGFIASRINTNSGKIDILNTRDSNLSINYIILRYTKTSASRSPEENDIKNENEEKNGEEVKNEK